MIKRNESDVGDIGFEILAKTVFQFLCFILLLALTNSSKLCNHISNCNGVCIKMRHFEVMRKWCKKMRIEICDKWLISLDHVRSCQCWGNNNNLSDLGVSFKYQIMLLDWCGSLVSFGLFSMVENCCLLYPLIIVMP